MLKKFWVVACMTVLPLLTCAEELKERRMLMAEVSEAFAREDFAEIQKMQASFDKTQARFPSGVFKSARIFYALDGVVWQPLIPGDGATSVSRNTEAHWIAMQAKAMRWQNAFPKSTLATYVIAKAHLNHASFLRGSRPESEVTKDQWLAVGSAIEKAVKAYSRESLLHDEGWYVGMMDTLQYTGVDIQKFAQFVDEASDKFPYYYEIYFYGAKKLDPRAGGGAEAFEWLANLAANKTRQKEGEALYARLYWSIGQSYLRDDFFSQTKADWPRMKKGFDDVIKRYPDPWNVSNYAWFACKAKDAAKTKQLLARLGDNVDRSIWDSAPAFNRCVSLAREG